MTNRGTIFQYGTGDERKQVILPLGFSFVQVDDEKRIQHVWVGDGKRRGSVPVSQSILSFGLPYKACQNQYFQTISGIPTNINSYFLPAGSVIHGVIISASIIHEESKLNIIINDDIVKEVIVESVMTELKDEITINQGGIVRVEIIEGIMDYPEIIMMLSIDQR